MGVLEDFYVKPGDITVEVAGKVFIHRCGYIVVRDGKILMLRVKDRNHFFLPGGRVAIDTTAEESVVHEILEETGLHVTEDDLSFAVMSQRFFTHRSGKKCHEICMFYRVTLPENAVIPEYELDGAGFKFVWLPLNGITSYDLREHFLFEQVEDVSQGVHLVSFREA